MSYTQPRTKAKSPVSWARYLCYYAPAILAIFCLIFSLYQTYQIRQTHKQLLSLQYKFESKVAAFTDEINRS